MRLKMRRWVVRSVLATGLIASVCGRPVGAEEIVFGINSNWLILKDEERTNILTIRVFGRHIENGNISPRSTNILNIDCSTYGAIIRFSLPPSQWAAFFGDISARQRASVSFTSTQSTPQNVPSGRPLIMTSNGRGNFVSADIEPDPQSPLFRAARADLLMRFEMVGQTRYFRIQKREIIDQMVKRSWIDQNVIYSEHSDAEAFTLCTEHIEFVRFAQMRIDAESGRTFSLPRLNRGAAYTAVRRTLIRSGWSPIIDERVDWCLPEDDRCLDRPEMVACSGTGRAVCRFAWQRGDTKIHILTIGESRDNVVDGVQCFSGCRR